MRIEGEACIAVLDLWDNGELSTLQIQLTLDDVLDIQDWTGLMVSEVLDPRGWTRRLISWR